LSELVFVRELTGAKMSAATSISAISTMSIDATNVEKKKLSIGQRIAKSKQSKGSKSIG
jgi:hypothetical protein